MWYKSVFERFFTKSVVSKVTLGKTLASCAQKKVRWAQPTVEGTEQLLLAARTENTQCCQERENIPDENARQIKA